MDAAVPRRLAASRAAPRAARRAWRASVAVRGSRSGLSARRRWPGWPRAGWNRSARGRAARGARLKAFGTPPRPPTRCSSAAAASAAAARRASVTATSIWCASVPVARAADLRAPSSTDRRPDFPACRTASARFTMPQVLRSDLNVTHARPSDTFIVTDVLALPWVMGESGAREQTGAPQHLPSVYLASILISALRQMTRISLAMLCESSEVEVIYGRGGRGGRR